MDQTHRKMSLMPCMMLAVQVAGFRYFHKSHHLLTISDPYYHITWSPKWSIIKSLTAKHIWGELLISHTSLLEPLLETFVKHYFNVVVFQFFFFFREKIKDCLLLDDEEAVWISRCLCSFRYHLLGLLQGREKLKSFVMFLIYDHLTISITLCYHIVFFLFNRVCINRSNKRKTI